MKSSYSPDYPKWKLFLMYENNFKVSCINQQLKQRQQEVKRKIPLNYKSTKHIFLDFIQWC